MPFFKMRTIPTLEARRLEPTENWNDWQPMLDWIESKDGAGSIVMAQEDDTPLAIKISNDAGELICAPGDWLILTPRGQFFPYDNAEFIEKYVEFAA